jgi:ATPase, P-type (transporting), HAD superfamily, subfamily IC
MKKKRIFDFLDDEKIADKIIDFNHKNITIVRFLIPAIHCTSCVFALEKLSNKNQNILNSTVDFSSKQIWITFNNVNLKLSDVATILDNMGYRPSINFESIENKKNYINSFDKKLIGKLAVSFFCFGNIMLLAIPEYVGALEEDIWFMEKRNFFRYLMVILSIPVVIFSFSDHIKYAILGLKKHVLNMSIPISIGILVLFLWSCYEIFFDLGSGYFDSLSSFSLFLLLSEIFQIYTHNEILSFDRNYKSFYPILLTKIQHNTNQGEEKILLSSLKIGDLILIRNEEIIPADCILIKGNAILDNSFITGESYLISKKIGERIYAGSKQKGEAIIIKVIKNIDRSYLSFLWNKNKYNPSKKLLNSISTRFSQYFTPIVLIISIITGIYWSFSNDITKVFHTVFSVLIVTCPCALVLSAPLIFGNVIRFFSKKGLYVKDIYTMERISLTRTLIFDKTGTITDPNKEKICFIGNIKNEEKKMIASLLNNSNHPLSKKILSELSINIKDFYLIKNFKEVIGKGLEGVIKNIPIKIGSPKYLGITKKVIHENKIHRTTVFISINKKFVGYFLFRNHYREGIEKMFQNLKEYKIVILSGDHNELEKKYLKSILPKYSQVFFNQSPEEKLNYVKQLQNKGEKIIMFGDGINDCAALNQSEVGIAVSENPTSFFPSCDAFMLSSSLNRIFLFLKISKISTKLVFINFLISLFYNSIGILFAITGNLKPIIAAILMPLSSFSVIFFSLISTWIVSRKLIL